MIPVKQAITHEPAAGRWGDCHRAAIASVLKLPLKAVPHFADGGPSVEEFNARVRDFLNLHGLTPINAVYAGAELAAGPDLILEVVSALNPGTPFLLGGRSRHGGDHTVVCLDGVITHDPSHDEAGVVGPSSDGWYWVTFIGVLNPDARPRCGLCGSPLTPDGLCSRAACANSD